MKQGVGRRDREKQNLVGLLALTPALSGCGDGSCLAGFG